MRKTSYLLSLLVLFLLSTVSCNRQETTQTAPVPKTKKQREKTALVNPYNYVGVYHNQSLLRFATENNFPNLPMGNAIKIAANYANELKVPNAEYATEELQARCLEVYPTYQSMQDYETVAKSLYGQGKISLDVKDALMLLDAQYKDAISTSHINDVEAMAYLMANYKDAEQILLQNQSRYSEEDKAIILSTVSTAVHSAEFWNDAMSNPANPYYELVPSGFWQRFRVICADAIGGLIGGVAGSGGGLGGACAGALCLGGIASHMAL